jgi:hypothetical protein
MMGVEHSMKSLPYNTSTSGRVTAHVVPTPWAIYRTRNDPNIRASPSVSYEMLPLVKRGVTVQDSRVAYHHATTTCRLT